MRKKAKWKRLLIGVLCMMLLASNAASVFAEDADASAITVSGNDISGNNVSGVSGEAETEENGLGKSEEKETDTEQGRETGETTEPEDDIGCEHEYHYTSNGGGTHTVTCINCDLEETENCSFTENAEEGQICEKCGSAAEAGDDMAAEDPLQFLSLETDGYDISAADRTYTAGENVTAYYFAADGTLLFEGTGEMIGCDMYSDIPWSGETINTAIIGEGITTIGVNALSYHQELADVTLPDSLKVISDYAFCETYSYSGTKGNLRNIEIPDGVEKIGEFAFRGNALETIRIPDSVTDIGENAFADCRDAESLSIGSGISEIKGRTFSELLSLKTIRIPGNVETIQNAAFRKTEATEIIISDGVKVIGEGAFESCENVEMIALGSSVETIGRSAFSECKKLKTLATPDSVITIDSSAFTSCNSLSDLTFGSGLLTIESYAFDGAHVLERLEIPDNVTGIASNAFHDSRALKNISIGSGITRLGYRVFFVEDMTETNVETENKTALNYDWAGDGREVTFKSKVIFKDHAGNSLLELLLEHGETIMDKAPAMEDYEEGGYTYVFNRWEPEITEDTSPIFAGFWFLGLTYGIYMNVSGFSFWYPMLMSLTIFAGSVEFVAVNMLIGSFNPLQALAMTLMINARHLFYGISMLDKYRGTGWKKAYLIFGMCDESFSINYTTEIPEDVDRSWFMFFVTLLNHFYWFSGATLGGIFGSLIHFNTEGLDFVMTAMFVVIFMEQWLKEKRHTSALAGISLSLLCLIAFGADSFIIPAMAAILAVLTGLRGRLEKGGTTV